ncbi:hypothetical protein C1706_03675 [Propioniciclava flava]|uniref:Uncharacterized protein n=2 Tax=Propioniciclava flava TaxID=2072026 RepID=A0A4Q2ELQ2_9ACTN|nr:hypothetical protein C1706_03675 [Propioniciclava flava]
MENGRDYGADMLAALEVKLASGDITQAQHDAERVRVIEAIRQGATVCVSPLRRGIMILCSAILILAGLVFAFLTQTIFGVALGAALVWAGVFGIRHAAR